MRLCIAAICLISLSFATVRAGEQVPARSAEILLPPSPPLAAPVLGPEEIGREASDTPMGESLDLAAAEARLLANNPELRAERRRAAVAWAAAAEAARWEDPELRLESKRVMEKEDNPWIYGAGLTVKLPTSGALGAEWLVHRAEAVAECRAVELQEWGRLHRFREAWVSYALDEERLARMETYLDSLTPLERIADKLESSGEMNRIERRRIALARLRMQAEIETLRLDLQERMLTLRLDLDLQPEGKPTLRPTADVALPMPDKVNENANPRVCWLEALRSVAALRGRLENRRAVPDLSLSPSYEREDGYDKIGVELELPLPVWNRNRQNRAVAHAQQDAAVEALRAERIRLRAEEARARLRLAKGEKQLAYREESIRPELVLQLKETQEQAELGEVDVTLYLDTLRAILDNDLALLDARRDAALAALRLIELAGPSFGAR